LRSRVDGSAGRPALANRRPAAAMAAFIVLLLLVGWGMFFGVVLPGNYSVGNNAVFEFGLALAAFSLGIRHAFDADHIAAIDNTTRKLIADGQNPMSVGFWFALGHSTVVIFAVALLATGVATLVPHFSDSNSILAVIAGSWGVLFSGLFLVLIGTLNLASLAGILRARRAAKAGNYDESELESLLQKRGALNRFFGPVARRVDKPWKMYPVGVLFGLGLDTATTVVLLVIGGSAALLAPWYVIMVLPILFTAGMTLFDTLDGVLMNRTYQWAYARPLRKIYYNLTVTIMSIVVAFLVGGMGLIGLIAEHTRLHSGPLAWMASISLDNLGYIIVGLFAVTWLGSRAYSAWHARTESIIPNHAMSGDNTKW
jgi:nickel/cobalt transporter (NiCoT) family protein